MTQKVKIIVLTAGILVAFAAGRYSVTPPAVKEVINTDTQTDTQKDTHQTIVRVKEPGGKTVTTITTDTKTNSEETKHQDVSLDLSPRAKWNVSGLVGTDIHSLRPIYGISINKEFLGPITIGAYGLTSGMIGLSIGVNF